MNIFKIYTKLLNMSIKNHIVEFSQAYSINYLIFCFGILIVEKDLIFSPGLI